MPARRQYPNPPIVEGVVQFNFMQPIAWNVATPGRVFERLRDAYPTDPEQQGVLQAAFNVNPEDNVLPNFTLTQDSQRVIYKDESQTRLLVLNNRMFSVNSLRPYEGWESLAARMTAAIEALQGTLSLPLINEVSVRYINQISVPRSQRIEDYFNYEIRTARSGASYLSNFVHRVESVLPDQVTTAGTTFASAQPGTEEIYPILLDIEFKRALTEGHLVDTAVDVAVDLKQLENAEFESVITDNARGLFV